MTDQRNEGEGNRTAARHFNDAQKAFAKSGKVGEAASDAEKAMKSGERAELDKAEQAGKQRARGEDPQVKR